MKKMNEIGQLPLMFLKVKKNKITSPGHICGCTSASTDLNVSEGLLDDHVGEVCDLEVVDEVGIEEMKVWFNTSPLHDQVLSHPGHTLFSNLLLQLIRLHTNKEKFNRNLVQTVVDR